MSSATITLPASPFCVRAGIVTLVLLLHAGLWWAWLALPEQPEIAVNEISVSIAMQQAPVAGPQADPPQPKPQLKLRTERAEKPIQKQAVQQAAETAPQSLPVAIPQTMTAPPAVAATQAETTAVAPVADVEPDYKAAYLNNPRPAYPMVARRMGWQGRVILNVEVLAEGACGGVNVYRSSGHEVLDNAAMNTVKSWQFVPAKRAGRVVTQWFKVPIVFSLEDNAT